MTPEQTQQAKQLKELLPSNCNNFRASNRWTEAFQLYNEVNPNKRVKVGCSSCCQTVLNWIRKQ